MKSMSTEGFVLLQAYLGQKVQYEQATRLTEFIHREFEQGRHPHDELQQMSEIMARIAESDKRIAGVRDAIDPRVKQHSQLQQVIDELKAIVEHLLQQINMIEQLARASRQKLAPQISKQVRESRMRSAYSQA